MIILYNFWIFNFWLIWNTLKCLYDVWYTGTCGVWSPIIHSWQTAKYQIIGTTTLTWENSKLRMRNFRTFWMISDLSQKRQLIILIWTTEMSKWLLSFSHYKLLIDSCMNSWESTLHRLHPMLISIRDGPMNLITFFQ